MAQISLKKILGKEGGQVLTKLFIPLDEPIGILDQEGDLLMGVIPDPAVLVGEKRPILFEGRPIGWVIGIQDSKWIPCISTLLEYWANQEAEKRAVVADALDKYRELNLLYRLSEKLVASPQPGTIASMTLNEVCPLIQVSGGLVIIEHVDEMNRELLATCGDADGFNIDASGPDNLVHRVLESGIAEIGNNLYGRDYLIGRSDASISILCAPLKTEKGVFGAIILIGDESKVFTAGDLKLVSAIAMQTAPAIEIAHLHQMELEKAVIERDLQTAYQVQSGLLPREMPRLDGWHLAAYWKPAREVGGDFYEFIPLPDGRFAIAVADVSDKGVPAALVMANTHSVLRAITTSLNEDDLVTPGMLLSRVNTVLYDSIPMNMFITCLLVILDLQTGHIWFANAGHNLPYKRSAEGVIELHATGVPLAVFPDITYDEYETSLGFGESLLMYSDGLVEVHDAQGEMYGFNRLYQSMGNHGGSAPLKGEALIQYLLSRLDEFTGPDWEQEDDVTIVALDRG